MLMNQGWSLSNARSLISVLQSSLCCAVVLSSLFPLSPVMSSLISCCPWPHTCSRGPQLSTSYSLTSISSCTTDTAEFGHRTLTPGHRSGPQPCRGHGFLARGPPKQHNLMTTFLRFGEFVDKWYLYDLIRAFSAYAPLMDMFGVDLHAYFSH